VGGEWGAWRTMRMQLMTRHGLQAILVHKGGDQKSGGCSCEMNDGPRASDGRFEQREDEKRRPSNRVPPKICDLCLLRSGDACLLHHPQVEASGLPVTCTAISPSGEAWALGDAGGCVRVWAESTSPAIHPGGWVSPAARWSSGPVPGC
jgi:hypothetical protein